jgi:hypothetical protein
MLSSWKFHLNLVFRLLDVCLTHPKLHVHKKLKFHYVNKNCFGSSDILLPSSSALIQMSVCTSQCLFSHSFTTYE